MAWHDDIQNAILDEWKEDLFKGEVDDLKEIEGALNDYFKETGVKHEEIEVYNPDTVESAELFDEKIKELDGMEWYEKLLTCRFTGADGEYQLIVRNNTGTDYDVRKWAMKIVNREGIETSSFMVLNNTLSDYLEDKNDIIENFKEWEFSEILTGMTREGLIEWKCDDFKSLINDYSERWMYNVNSYQLGGEKIEVIEKNKNSTAPEILKCFNEASEKILNYGIKLLEDNEDLKKYIGSTLEETLNNALVKNERNEIIFDKKINFFKNVISTSEMLKTIELDMKNKMNEINPTTNEEKNCKDSLIFMNENKYLKEWFSQDPKLEKISNQMDLYKNESKEEQK